MAQLKRSVRCSTLIETLVAMTIIVIVIAGSFISIIKIKKSYNNELRINAFLAINKQIQIEESSKLILGSKNLDFPSFTVTVERIIQENNPSLYTMSLKAKTRDSILLYETQAVFKINRGKRQLQ